MTPLDQLVAGVGGRLEVEADLRLAVDGQPLRLAGAGRHLVLHVQDLRGLTRLGADPASVGARQLASALAGLGLTLDVVGPRGGLVVLGHDATDGMASRLLGVPVAPGSATGRTFRRVATATVAAIVAAVVLLRSRRRARADD